jgi:hypothetical protein
MIWSSFARTLRSRPDEHPHPPCEVRLLRGALGLRLTALCTAVIAVLVLWVPPVGAQCTGNSCPLCFTNMPAAPGHGKHGNDIILNVCVDTSWSSTASATMQQAVQDAASSWNSTVSACSLAGGYYINPNQNCSVADIIIHAGTPSQGTCAENGLNSISGTNRSGSDTVTMLAKVANDEGSAARLVEHEIAHSMGLEHQSGSSCGSLGSIMNLVAPISTCYALGGAIARPTRDSRTKACPLQASARWTYTILTQSRHLRPARAVRGVAST